MLEALMLQITYIHCADSRQQWWGNSAVQRWLTWLCLQWRATSPACWQRTSLAVEHLGSSDVPRPHLQVCFCFYEHNNHLTALVPRTTRVGRYQKKHSPTHTHPDHMTSFINLIHQLRSTASFLFTLCAWQFFSTTSLQVLFRLPLGLGPSTNTPYISSYNHHLLFATNA